MLRIRLHSELNVVIFNPVEILGYIEKANFEVGEAKPERATPVRE